MQTIVLCGLFCWLKMLSLSALRVMRSPITALLPHTLFLITFWPHRDKLSLLPAECRLSLKAWQPLCGSLPQLTDSRAITGLSLVITDVNTYTQADCSFQKRKDYWLSHLSRPAWHIVSGFTLAGQENGRETRRDPPSIPVGGAEPRQTEWR